MNVLFYKESDCRVRVLPRAIRTHSRAPCYLLGSVFLSGCSLGKGRRMTRIFLMGRGDCHHIENLGETFHKDSSTFCRLKF